MELRLTASLGLAGPEICPMLGQQPVQPTRSAVMITRAESRQLGRDGENDYSNT